MTVPQRRIFLSHSHLDNEFGTRLAQDLRRVLQDASAVWYDVLGGLHGGDTWWEKIVDELTARPVFMVILSPDAIISPWVRDEINLAWKQKNSKVGKLILPLLYRECKVREDLDTLQVISFLGPCTYEAGFNEILRALGVSIQQDIPAPKTSSQPGDVGRVLVRQMETAFAGQDWSDVIRKAEYIIKHMPGAITATVYRLQGLAFNGKGATLSDLKRYEEALVAYEQALRLDPNFAVAYYNKGLSLEQLGRKREAQEAREKARSLGYNP